MHVQTLLPTQICTGHLYPLALLMDWLLARAVINSHRSQAIIECVTLFRILLAWELPPYHLVVLLGLLMLL